VSKKRSDALQALVAELVEADRTIAVARDAEEEAQREFVAARQVLDGALARTKAAVGRRTITNDALRLIQTRDEIGDDGRAGPRGAGGTMMPAVSASGHPCADARADRLPAGTVGLNPTQDPIA
jgi:hypothetical protein